VETIPATETYPRLLRRLRGALIDGIFIPLAALGTLVALAYAGVESTWVKVLCPLIVILLLDPVAVSATGGSIGHHLVGLRVRKERTDERIGLLAAVVRLLVKTFFGLPAFFVAFVTRKRQALHDLVARSLIVHKSTVGLPLHELLPERTRRDEHAALVSVWRRILVILLYWVLFYLAWIGPSRDEIGHLGRRPHLHSGDGRALHRGRRPLHAGSAREHREHVRGDAASVRSNRSTS